MEFQADFEHTVNNHISTLKDHERLLNTDFNDASASILHPGSGVGMSDLKEMDYQRRLGLYEDKLKQAQLEMKNECALRELSDQQARLQQNHNKELQKMIDNIRDENLRLLKETEKQQEFIKNSIDKDESVRIVRENEKLYKDLTATRAALLSYKNMQNVVTEQVKSLKLMHERKRNENESLVQTLRDLQAESPDK
jgi:triphosphoribosyl-dephospho-CoA synthetase